MLRKPGYYAARLDYTDGGEGTARSERYTIRVAEYYGDGSDTTAMEIYYAIPKKYFPAKNATLLIFSLIFYSWGEPVYVLLMIYTSFFNYFMAHIIVRAKIRGGRGRPDFVFTIFVNLSILCFFKYFGFLMDTVNGIFGSNISYTALPLPVGISFYTF